MSDSQPLPSDLMELYGPAELDPELKRCIFKANGLGEFVGHPLIHTHYFPQMNKLLNAQLAARREQVEKCLKEKRWGSYVCMHERPYRLEKLSEIADDIPDKDYWEIFGWVWTDSENLWQFNHILPEMIHSNRPQREYFMHDEEREFLAELPDHVRIFRGHQYVNRKGYAWSLSFQKADWFAHRFGKRCGVIAGTIHKSHIIAVKLNRGEMEVVINPEDVSGAKPVVLRRTPYLKSVHDEALRQRIMKSQIHGVSHWDKVEMNVIALAKNTPGADMLVCRLFAMLHDVKRVNDGDDADHGPNAAVMAKAMHESGLLKITQEQLDKLVYACNHHDQGMTSDDPTIGCCWDADRLDLMRVGIVPDPKYLSTQYGKSHIFLI